ncbi:MULTISPECIES: PaaI family thioesterase [unclassified Mycolicibacterium]|uniref:PaaI family thioesterase n=1 Tax=unclassified Mycolicibacterium TaxID=2636767 RepID=UPI002EDAD9EF
MRYPPNTPLGRFQIETLEEGTDRCVASIPIAGLVNPLTGAPTLGPLAMLVDHIGGLANHLRRNPGEWTVTSELAVEFTGIATTVVARAAEQPVTASARPFGPKGPTSMSICELTRGRVPVATATVRSFHIRAPEHFERWPTSSDDTETADVPPTLAARLAVDVAEGGGVKALRQLQDPALNNLIGIVHGGISATALELVASAAVNDGRTQRPLQTASLRVNYLRQFVAGGESRYEATALRVGRSSGVADAKAVGTDGQVALLARLTAYPGID